jgi:CubicO group peptidase (beta-lactamase class C family)
MKKYNIPGAAATVVKGDKLVYACAFGYADLKSGAEVKPQDLFRLASISKPITSSAIRKLRDDGKLSFSDKMLDRLGSAKPDEPYKDDGLEDITIQNLLDHKGGWNLGKMGFDPMFYSDSSTPAPSKTSTN